MVVVGRSGAMSAAVMRPIDENLDAGARIVLIAGIVMVGGGTGVGIRTRVELCPEPLDSLLLPVRAILPINRSKSDCFIGVVASTCPKRVAFQFSRINNPP